MSERKRILVVCQHFWPESFRINDICDYFVENDIEVDVLCGIPNYPKGQFFEGYSYFKNRRQTHNGIRVERALEIPRGSKTNARIFLNYISFPIASLFHIPRLLTRKYDRIFLYQTSPVMMAIAGMVLGKLTRTQTTLYVLDLWPENLFSVLPLKNPILHSLATRVSHWHYRHVDKIVVLSQKMRDQLEAVTHLPAEKLVVLPQTSEKLYETDVEDAELKQRFKGTFNIVFAGNISPAQSFDTVVAAAEKLNADGLDDIRWIIIGDGMSRQWLEDEVAQRGLSASFAFEGMKPMADIPKYHTVADLLVGCLVKSNLLEATIPAKVMSYIAAGRPMVLAMDGEVQDLINNEVKSGLAGPASDADALYGNIKTIYQLPAAERSAMGKRGRAYHFKYYERNLILAKLQRFIFS